MSNPHIINLKLHYTDGVPWLSDRNYGELKGALGMESGGLADVAASGRLRLIVPENSGVTKSFLEGFLYEFAERTFQKDPTLPLAELVSIDPEKPDQSIKGRFNATSNNLSAALVSLVEFLKQAKLIETA